MTEPATSADAGTPLGDREVVRRVARAHERDRYLTALLAPPGLRDDLLALAAFAGELARIPAYVSQPLVGEMRLQFWRDALVGGLDGKDAGEIDGRASGHPVARAIISTARRRGLSRASLDALIDAQSDRLEDEPFADMAALEANVAAWDGGLFALAYRIIASAQVERATSDNVPDTMVSAGLAYGLARVALDAPIDLQHGRVLLPLDVRMRSGVVLNCGLDAIDSAGWRHAVEQIGSVAQARYEDLLPSYQMARLSTRLAALPIALVRPYLELTRRVDIGAANVRDVSPLTRVWRLWAARRLGRIGL